MMESLQLLFYGFSVALEPTNLLFAFAGCLLGTLIGVLPGLGPAGGIAILISVTFSLDPIPAIIMLCSIYYGAMYGGTITSILVNTPGEAASAITCLEGYEMAKRGRAGAALAIAAIGSFIGGTVAMFALVFVAKPLSGFALRFGPVETFALMVLGLSLIVSLAGASVVRALISAVIGMMIAMVGIDPVMGYPRFAFGVLELMDGFDLVPVVMGLFGLSEILITAEKKITGSLTAPMSSLVPTREDLKASAAPIARGTGIGFFLGLIPGVNAVIATFVSYAAEKRFSRNPEKFGTGMIQGVAGPETANNSHHIAALIPLFTLGIPASATIAIIMGAFMMNGLVPGPYLFIERPDVVWSIIASLYIGNVILLILNLPLIPIWVSVLKIPYPILFALILAFIVVGAYSIANSTFDIGVMAVFGVVGYFAKKLDFPLAPFVLTLVLGGMLERNLRTSLEMSGGSFDIFLESPISASLIVLAVVVAVVSAVQRMRAARSARTSLLSIREEE